MFAFRLAAKLGKTVKTLLQEIDSHELSEWMAFDQLSPLDSDYRNEIAQAKIEHILYHANRDPDKGEAMALSEFIPRYGAEYRDEVELEVISPEVAVARIRAGFASMRNK